MQVLQLINCSVSIVSDDETIEIYGLNELTLSNPMKIERVWSGDRRVSQMQHTGLDQSATITLKTMPLTREILNKVDKLYDSMKEFTLSVIDVTTGEGYALKDATLDARPLPDNISNDGNSSNILTLEFQGSEIIRV